MPSSQKKTVVKPVVKMYMWMPELRVEDDGALDRADSVEAEARERICRFIWLTAEKDRGKIDAALLVARGGDTVLKEKNEMTVAGGHLTVTISGDCLASLQSHRQVSMAIHGGDI